ncbi:MAG: UPF0147 family protein [Candidatus Aenigmatarchaeota archaeon]|nr:UPF0147 family protein [Candidatus Aenigmarchaeota archaeon]
MQVEITEFEPVFKLLDEIINDRTVPKNIRAAAESSKTILSNDSENLELRISTAIHTLDEIINDPNMPIYARTKIWNVVSALEQKRRELS